MKGETLYTSMWKCILRFLTHSGLATTSCSAGLLWDIYRQPSSKGTSSTGFKYTAYEGVCRNPVQMCFSIYCEVLNIQFIAYASVNIY